MTDQGVTYQQVTVSEAAAILGVSVMTVRRMIKRGQLEGERVHRPQGTAYVVRLSSDASGNTQQAPATEQMAENVSRTNGTGSAPAEAMVSLIQTTIATVLGPLVGQIDAQRQTIDRQAGEIAELREERGRLLERLETAAPVERPAASNPTPDPPTLGTGRPLPPAWMSRRWAVILAVVAVLLAAGGWVVSLTR